MSTLMTGKPWDLSHVLDLVNSLADQQHDPKDAIASLPPLQNQSSEEPHDSGIGEDDIEKKDFAPKPAAGLGDFARIWQYMGVPADREDDGAYGKLHSLMDYTSDGATYVRPGENRKRGVTWQDQTSADDGGSTTDRSASPNDPKLTKSQRKKKNRKERKAQEAAEEKRKGAVSESEADHLSHKAPAKKASAHAIPPTPTKRYNLRERNEAGHAVTESTQDTGNKVLKSAPKSPSKPSLSHSKEQDAAHTPATPRPKNLEASDRQKSYPATTTPVKHTQAAALYANNMPPEPQYGLATPSKPRTHSFVPSTVQPPKKQAQDSFPSPQEAAQKAVQAVQNAQAARNATPSKTKPSNAPDKFGSSMAVQYANAPKANAPPTQPKNFIPTNRTNTIEPKMIRSGEDRNWALFLRLLTEHPEERKYMVAPMNMTNHSNNPKGIHVFVDYSNIFIGFNDQLKRERGMPVFWKTDSANLSFDALALLMERRRPVAKRVLAGSLPHLPAFDKAKETGYEVSLLEKVYKAKELTERQLYFRDQDIARGKRVAKTTTANGDVYNGGGGPGSETTGPQFAPAKMIEQGVDEILHLKILESVVDSQEPSTMVIATGDAAQAEYSDGFMAMAERALKKGWKIELVSWSKNISRMYMREEFRTRWGTQFKPVFLDNYAEELLDM